jgi:hypothetical protein
MGKKKAVEQSDAATEADSSDVPAVATEDAGDPSSEPSEPAASDGLTPRQKQHYDEIIRLNVSVSVAEYDYEDAKDKASAAKKNLERLQSQLSMLIARGADPQTTLPFPEDQLPKEDWRTVAIGSVVELTDKQAEKLEEAGIKTVGQFEDLRSGQMDGYPNGLRSLKGVGQKTVDAWEEQMVEWLSENARETEPAESGEGEGE